MAAATALFFFPHWLLDFRQLEKSLAKKGGKTDRLGSSSRPGLPTASHLSSRTLFSFPLPGRLGFFTLCSHTLCSQTNESPFAAFFSTLLAICLGLEMN